MVLDKLLSRLRGATEGYREVVGESCSGFSERGAAEQRLLAVAGDIVELIKALDLDPRGGTLTKERERIKAFLAAGGALTDPPL